MTKGQEQKREVAELRMLRFLLGKTRLDGIKKTEIR